MGYTAWDTDLSRLVDADECVKKVKGHYLCPTEACRNIGVQLCLHECDNGNHFNSMPGYADKHVEACDFPSQHSDGQGYRKKKFGILNLETLIENLKTKVDPKNTATGKPLEKAGHIDKPEDKNDTIVDINSLYKLYCAITHNSLDYYITADYKVNDICIDQRNVAFAKKYIRKSVMFFGTTNGIGFGKNMLRVECRISSEVKGVSVCIDLDDVSYRRMKARLEDFDEDAKGIRVAVLGDFKVRKASFTNSDGKTIIYDENYAVCSLAQIKIIDRVKPHNQTTEKTRHSRNQGTPVL